MADFELLGSESDETRLLTDLSTGYSVPIPGHPSVVAATTELPRYDVVLALADVKAQFGFRIDEIPSTADPQAMAESIALAYCRSRAEDPAKVQTMDVPPTLRPATAQGGADATYSLRDPAEVTLEHVWVATMPLGDRTLALYRTTRFRPKDLYIVKWHHLRTSFSAHHVWDRDAKRERVRIWPESTITRASADLDLTEAAWREAEVKANDVGQVDSQQALELGELLIQVAETDMPPAMPTPPFLLDHHARKFERYGRPGAVLIRNLHECKTAFDLRGWTWQCVWAIGNRASRRRP